MAQSGQERVIHIVIEYLHIGMQAPAAAVGSVDPPINGSTPFTVPGQDDLTQVSQQIKSAGQASRS